jgi:ubiquinol-cytochrome c reductase cytochrome c subunit
MMLRTPAGASIVVLMLVSLAAAAGQDREPKPNIENGRRAYMRTGCYQCHGREGQGSPTTGPRLGPPSSPFAAFEAWVRRPRGEMPPYTSAVLSDADLADIYAFMRTRPRPSPDLRLPQ